MRKIRNTLYVTKPEYYLGRNGKTVEVREGEEVIGQLPIHNFEQIVTMNYTGISPGLLRLCAEEGVTVTYLSPTGKYIGTFETGIKGSILTRKKQFRLSEDEESSLEIARGFILGKVQNSITLSRRFFWDHPERKTETVEKCLEYLEGSKGRIMDVENKEELRGVEGDASRTYFKIFQEMILNEEEGFQFNGRNRNPPLDPLNGLLSLSYGFLRVRVEGALNTVGLDPYAGFLHSDRSGRRSLALDLMEELRPVLADRFVLSLVNRKQLKGRDFMRKANGAVELTEEGMKKFIREWNGQNLEIITHPTFEEKVEKGLLPFCQASLLSKYIRGDLELYPPYFMD